MIFTIVLTREALAQFRNLENSNPAKYTKVCKTIGLMETNLRSKSLNTVSVKQQPPSIVNRKMLHLSSVFIGWFC